MTLSLNVDDLTLDEVELLEDISGVSLDALATAMADGKPKARLLKAMAFISMRRVDPAVTMEDVGRVRVASFGDVEVGAEIPPTDESES